MVYSFFAGVKLVPWRNFHGKNIVDYHIDPLPILEKDESVTSWKRKVRGIVDSTDLHQLTRQLLHHAKHRPKNRRYW